MPTVSRLSHPELESKPCSCANPALALVTGQLSKEITEVGKEVETLFGVLDEESLQLQ